MVKNLEDHTNRQHIENALFLLEMGEDFGHVARRLGLAEDTLEKMLYREKKGRN